MKAVWYTIVCIDEWANMNKKLPYLTTMVVPCMYLHLPCGIKVQYLSFSESFIIYGTHFAILHIPMYAYNFAYIYNRNKQLMGRQHGIE